MGGTEGGDQSLGRWGAHSELKKWQCKAWEKAISATLFPKQAAGGGSSLRSPRLTLHPKTDADDGEKKEADAQNSQGHTSGSGAPP